MPTITVQFSDYTVDDQGLHPTRSEIAEMLMVFNQEAENAEITPGAVFLSLLTASWAIFIAIIWGALQLWRLAGRWL